jgi:hypothetical protein
MVRIGEDEAPVAGGLLAQTGRVETIIYAQTQQTVLRDYLDPQTGKMKVFERVDVCKYPVDRIRHPYAIPALDLNPDALECRATVYGLDPAKIYVFRVHTGNSFGFEATGSNLMFGSTISLPTVGVQDLSAASIQSSENRSNYKVTLTWSKPIGWPVVSKYYASLVELSPPDYNVSGVIWKAAAGTAYRGRKVLESSLSPLTYQISDLTKGSRYAMRIHVGNNDGIDGFYPDMQMDPIVSNIVTVLLEDRPSRPRVGVGAPALPDRNSMLSLTFTEPDVGGVPTSYFAEYQDCGSGPEPV